MQSHSKISVASASTRTTTTPAVCDLQGWADLPEGLLHSIVPLLNSFLELLAFAGTCRSWRAVFASYPSKSTFCTLLPPLLVRARISICDLNLPSRSDDARMLRTCQVLDPANLKSTLRCQIPEETFELCIAGSSYGQLIYGGSRKCLVADVFTGAQVLPPQLPFDDDTHYSALLTAPLSSNNSHLLVCTASNLYGVQSLLDWPVGSDSWSELRLGDTRIEQIVEFNGQFIALDNRNKLHTLSLAPQLSLQEIATVSLDGMFKSTYLRPWLVVCGDLLLMVNHYMTFSVDAAPVYYIAYRLDMSTVPAVWVEVKKLENYSLFIGSGPRSPVFSCVSPGRWGGRSNCLYFGDCYQPWVLYGLGDDAGVVWNPRDNEPEELKFDMQTFWVYPSMFYR